MLEADLDLGLKGSSIERLLEESLTQKLPIAVAGTRKGSAQPGIPFVQLWTTPFERGVVAAM